MNSAVDPVAQLLLTLNIGIPVIPSWYKARWPHVESPNGLYILIGECVFIFNCDYI